MADWLANFYPWIKSLHIISVIAWMAGMLYLPRLFVYHCDAPPGSDKSETFKIMERRLLRAIINPAMVASFLFGILLLLTPGVVDWAAWWVYAKIVLVLTMAGLHGLFSRWRKDFEADRNTRPARVFRIANEGPTILMIAIVILVVVKPG
ncbi:MAG: protoporphyrinogen oxidase HemJ [Rhodospirillaceae bacterium]|jgi:protoporphyrinogen IX oxidase|nr:protoporphyrinogen oxidase HemJ [Rhodospirillaceae bacterium]MBT5458182.1 protoporphyrinogen oxidase HemJ [Rhodospirillaceae bacterium]